MSSFCRSMSAAVAALLFSMPLHGQFSELAEGPVPATVRMVLTPDKKHVTYAVPDGDKQRVFIDGRASGPEFDGLFFDKSFASTPDGLRHAYAVVKEDKDEECSSCDPVGEWRAVINGRIGPVYDRVSGPALSPDGRRFAYGAITVENGKDHWQLIVDGKATPLPYDALSFKSPAFTPDGCHVVYVARKGGKDGKAMVVVDGKEDPAFDKIGQPIPIFSPDGTHMAYSARNYGEPEFVLLDGTPGPAFDNIPPHSLVFSAQGNHLAYGGQFNDGKWSVVRDGAVGPKYDQVDRIAFSPDGAHLAYHAKKGDRWYLVVDGAEAVVCEELSKDFPTFAPDSARVAQGMRKDGKWVLVAVASDSRQVFPVGPEFGNGAGRPVFSRNSQHLAFIGWNGKKRIAVVDGKPGPAFDAITNLAFSPDGRRIAYEAGKFFPGDPTKKDTWFAVLDHKPKPEYDGLLRGSGIFSADSRHFAYSVSKGDQRLIVVDGQLSPGYRMVCSVLPRGTSGFEALAVGTQLLRVNWKPQS